MPAPALDARTLITVDVLRARLADPSLVVFDCRYDLASPGAGARAWAQGHVPGARFADVDRELSGARTGANGRHPLPDADAFAAWLGANGVDATKQVVAYDFAAGFGAARLWWMLRHWLGHARVAVLDGGWEAWVAAGAPVSGEAPRSVATTFAGRPHAGAIVDAPTLESHLGDPDFVIVDARSAARFRGEAEPIDPVAGRIPGARNRPYAENLGADGRFKPPAELRAEFERLLGATRPDQVVHQCGSGVSAAHNLLAMDVAGLTGARLYPGSWSEWCADPRRPVARG